MPGSLQQLPAPLASGFQRGSVPAGTAQQCQAPCPVLPGHRAPFSLESSRSSVKDGLPWAWGPGTGPGPRPWWPGSLPSLSFQRAPQLGQEAEKQVPGEFPLSVSLSPPSLPALGGGWAGAGLQQVQDPREIQASLGSLPKQRWGHEQA
jgi:hypothetical protein